MGKAYANRKRQNERPANDFYETPRSLVWELLNTNILKDCKTILDPCCGNGSISSELKKSGFIVEERDIVKGNDFLSSFETYNEYDAIVMNPPFSLFDNFIQKAKTLNCHKIVTLAKTDFFSAHSRNILGLWKNLEYVLVFDRKVDFRTLPREDGLFNVGCLTSAWFVFNKDWEQDYSKIKIIDVQKYAKLGEYKEIK